MTDKKQTPTVLAIPPKPVSAMSPEELDAFAEAIVDSLMGAEEDGKPKP